jgi:hypothetical protein
MYRQKSQLVEWIELVVDSPFRRLLLPLLLHHHQVQIFVSIQSSAY